MRPLEKLAGCIRVMIIYIVSGFVGSLASALFLRDSIQVGPGGGQFAILACYLTILSHLNVHHVNYLIAHLENLQ
jgi:membrane associated rhomboid family serine protease